MPRPAEWVVVHVARNRSVAEMIQDLLEQEGLEVMVRSPGLSPFIGVDLMVEVLVPAEQEEAARQALARFSAEPSGDRPEESPAPEGGEAEE